MALLAAGKTDIGQKRKTNQDAIYLNSEKRIYVVADGMGGHNGGDIASAMAVDIIPDFILKNGQLPPHDLLVGAILEANNKIKDRGMIDTELEGMGTTVVVNYFDDAYFYMACVGDSRSYLINSNNLYQLSRDHSLVQEKLNIGLYNRVQAAQDPHKNVLVRTVGFENDIDIDFYKYAASKGDLFLSCSDGLHGKVSDRDILYIINKEIPNPLLADQENLKQASNRLVEQANANGGQDNISVILTLIT